MESDRNKLKAPKLHEAILQSKLFIHNIILLLKLLKNI